MLHCARHTYGHSSMGLTPLLFTKKPQEEGVQVNCSLHRREEPLRVWVLRDQKGCRGPTRFMTSNRSTCPSQHGGCRHGDPASAAAASGPPGISARRPLPRTPISLLHLPTAQRWLSGLSCCLFSRAEGLHRHHLDTGRN